MIQLKIFQSKLTTLRILLRNSKIITLLRAHVHHLQQRRNRDLFAIDLNADLQGFFAQLTWCLIICNYCEAKKLTPYFILSGPAYVEIEKGKDWSCSPRITRSGSVANSVFEGKNGEYLCVS
jgi:hypothetical protein